MIEKIGVIDNDIKQEVLQILANSEYKPDVEIEPSWYYEHRG
ncbi:DarT ssDNA thymidine ADP-ribosyltransferase family protein [Thiospirochaeta perfilievii]